MARLYAEHPEEFADAGFKLDIHSDLQISQLQHFAATDNGAAFLSALIFHEFRQKYSNALDGAPPEHVAEAFSSYYRGKPVEFDKAYRTRLAEQQKAEKVADTPGEQRTARTVNSIINDPSGPRSPHQWPQGDINNWTERVKQLKDHLQ